MKTSLSWGSDRMPNPDPETLLNWYDQLDRQVTEIKRQMRRGVLTPQHVQAFVEHRPDNFPDKCWTITSKGKSTKELVDDLREKGWEFIKYFSPESYIHKITIPSERTYYLIGIEAHRFGGGGGKMGFPQMVSIAEKRGYQPVPQEAAIILGTMNGRKEFEGYTEVIVVTDFVKSWGHWIYSENGNVPGGNALIRSDDLFVFPVRHILLVFAVDVGK